MRRIILLGIICLEVGLYSYSQVNLKIKNTWNSELLDIVELRSDSNIIFFKKENNIKPDKLFNIYKSAFGLTKLDEMKSFRKDTDQLRQVHHRFQQFYNGVAIEGAEYIIHEKDGKVDNGNGIILSSFGGTKEKVGIKDAELTAIKSFTFSKIFSKTELVYTRICDSMKVTNVNMILAYKVNLLDSISHRRNLVYVSATDGNIFKITSLTCNGTCATLYNGYQQIQTKWYGFPDYGFYLIDYTRGVGIHTYIGSSSSESFNNNENNFSGSDASAHWAVEKAWDYFFNTYGRYGTNNANGGVDIRVNYGDQLNASFTKNGSYNNHDLLEFGSGDGGTNAYSFAALDAVSHEFTHGVTAYTAGLGTSYESGALNESFSDIFGTMVEFYIKGSAGNYEMGEDFAVNPRFKRSLANPKLYPTFYTSGSPDTYNAGPWYNGSADNGGVHINNGVQNHWFYLLAEGGSGTNDNSINYNVTGIGKTEAARIAYTTLASRLISSSTYADARSNSIQAAIDLYQDGSPEVFQTANAWYAVGVGGQYNCSSTRTISNASYTSNSILYACSLTLTNVSISNGANVAFHSANTITINGPFSTTNGITLKLGK